MTTTMTTTRRRDGRPVRTRGTAALVGLALVALAGCTGGTPEDEAADDGFSTREVTDGRTTFVVVDNPAGAPTLSYSPDSGVELLAVEVDGVEHAFKDMNGNGELDVWEDWREDARVRAAALAEELTIEQIAGLMLFSSHERSPADGVTDVQEEYLSGAHLRNVLNAGPNDVDANVTWSNAMQAYVERLATAGEPYVPVNFSSDPRTAAQLGGAYNADGADISRWPEHLGLAATFDPETVAAFSIMVSAEYRALGITTALSPQIDLATEPRWLRVNGTFGEDVELNTAMASAYVDGFQTTAGAAGADGWGEESVNAMIKHWAGDGPGEGGREGHMNSGKYGVYPGGAFDDHSAAFLASLDSAATMTAYSIAVDGSGDPLFGERVGAAYDTGRMALLRETNGYEGVVVTDWGVTRSRAWGAEDLTEAERHYAILRTGHDMFGGNNDAGPVLEAHALWQAAHEAGEVDVDADTRFRETGARVLTMMFRPGLYENPYLDLETSRATVASADKVAAGYRAQLDSVVMLKNADGTIASADAADWSDATAYIPRTYDIGFASRDNEPAYTEGPSLTVEAVEQHLGAVVTDEATVDAGGHVTGYAAPDLSDVDVVLVGMSSPVNGDNFSSAGEDTDTGEWYPLSLQYRPYTADGPHVRPTSLSGDILADGTQENRSYLGHTSRIANEADLDAFERAVAAVEASGRDIPVIVVLKANNPVVPAEFEATADAVIAGFGTSDSALVEVALGLHEPQGRLPITFPASMDAVEAQLEDVPGDTEPYVDSAGNAYTFGFGLGWSGAVQG